MCFELMKIGVATLSCCPSFLVFSYRKTLIFLINIRQKMGYGKQKSGI